MARKRNGEKPSQLEVGQNISVKLPTDGEDAHLIVSLLNQQTNRNKFILDSLLMMRASKNRVKRAGEPIVIHIPANESMETLAWLNMQEDLEKEVLTLIRDKAREVFQAYTRVMQSQDAPLQNNREERRQEPQPVESEGPLMRPLEKASSAASVPPDPAKEEIVMPSYRDKPVPSVNTDPAPKDEEENYDDELM